MNKALFLIIALLLVAALLLPNIIGRVAQSSTYHLAEQLNANRDEFGEVSIERYARGYASSETIVTWMPGSKQIALSAFIEQPIRLVCQGSHGFLSYSYQCTGENVEAYRKFVTTELNGIDPISISGDISVFGKIRLSLDLKEFQLQNSSNERITVKAGDLDFTTNKDAEEFYFSGEFDGLDAEGEDGSLAMQILKIDGNLRLNQFDIGIGSAAASVETLTLRSDQDGVLQLNGLNLEGDSKEQGTDLEMLYRLTVEQLRQTETPLANKGAQQSSKPNDLDLSKLLMEIRFAGVNMAQLSSLNQKWMALPSESESDNKASMLALIPEIEDLLKSGLSIDSRLAADYQSKPMSADFNLALVGDLTFGDFLLMKINPKTFFAKFKARMKTLVPQAVLDVNAKAMESVGNNPLYVKSGSNYESHIELLDGEIMINGEAVTLEQMMSLLNER